MIRFLLLLSVFCVAVPASKAQQTYTVITSQMGIDVLGLGSGVAWGDLDCDGDLDLLVSDSSYPYHLYIYRNDGSVFTDVTDSSGLTSEGRNFAVGDYDSDGLDDIALISFGYAETSLYRNLGGMQFEDRSDSAGIYGTYCWRSAWNDYDEDGDLDLYCCGATSCLFQNQGDGTFIDVAPAAGIVTGGKSCAWLDIDNDGFEDCYVGRTGSNLLYRNNGDGTFSEIASSAGVNDPCATAGVCSGDFNGDGFFDLYSVNISSPRNTLYMNNGNGTFTDVTMAAGVQDVGDGRTATFLDIDYDGLVDLFSSNHVYPNRLFRNNGDGTFTDIASSLGIQSPQDPFGTGFADFDGDGDLDAFLATHGNCDLLQCSGLVNHWVILNLIGTESNINAIGAVVRCAFDSDTTWTRVDGGHGMGDLDSRQVELGLGLGYGAFEITVYWPSGNVETYSDLAPDNYYDITEGAGAAAEHSACSVVEDLSILSVSPNPTEGLFSMSVSGATQPFAIRIHDLSGRLVWEGEADLSAEGVTTVMFPGHPSPGLYLVSITAEGMTDSAALVIVD
jgi:hypothetical protein